MRRMRRLKSEQRCDSNQLKLSFDISKPLVTPFGMDVAQFKKKATPEKQDTDLKKKQERQYQHLCLTERNTIAKMIKKGLCLSEIARNLGRGKQTIASEVSRNGGRDAYDPTEAHNKAMKRKLERDIKCSYSIKNRFSRPDQSIIERLENLEMQVEILSEILKEVTRERSKNDHKLRHV